MISIPLPQTDTLTHAPLQTLEPGRCATVSKLDAPPLIEARLNGMGICVGRTIEMVQHGDPMIVRACGSRIGLAHVLSQAILIEVCDATCTPAAPATPAADEPSLTA